MELLTGDRQLRNPDEFPQHIAPFPDTTDFVYTHPTAVIHSPANVMITHRPNLPPQKLRPIRGSGRSPASSQADDPSDNGGLSCTLEKFSEVGFLGDRLCSVNGVSGEYFESPEKAEVGDVTNNAGGAPCLLLDNPAHVGSGMGDRNWGPHCDGRVLEDESSSSSESDDDDLSADIKVPANRKRKRKARKKIELFLENLVMKVMEKQEHMHNELIEMIEKRERERIIREEAWKQQERERMKRDEEVRAQETSRSLALISFIQNVLGHEIEVPQPSTVSCVEEDGGRDGGEIHIQKDIKCDLNNKRWPEDEVQALIMLRTSLDHKFRVMGPKCSVWDEISGGMYNMGYNRTAKKCREKWENINKYFRKSMENGKKRLENSKICPYFHELDMLYKNGLVNPANALNYIKHENEARGERE